MNYPIFLCDFDGTLVRNDGTVTQTNIDAIAKYRAAGGVFAVCTGRMLASIRQRLQELGLTDGLVVAFQGAQIADIATGKLLKDACYIEEDILEILRFMEAHGLRIQIYVGDDLIANGRSDLLRMYEEVCRVTAKIADEPLSELVAREHMRVIKVLTICTPEEQPALDKLLTEKFGEKYYVACSAEYLVEVMPKGESKAAAVEFFSKYYRVGKEKIAAIGDQGTDIPMIKAAGGKFAVANAVEPLKSIATVVPPVDDDGVAYALYNYAMGEKQ